MEVEQLSKRKYSSLKMCRLWETKMSSKMSP